jgi:hypothetical protein
MQLAKLVAARFAWRTCAAVAGLPELDELEEVVPQAAIAAEAAIAAVANGRREGVLNMT